MVRIRENEIRLFYNKVTLNTTSGDEVIYTDTPSMYQEMVEKFKHILSCTVEPVTLTDEQNKRLEALKNLTGRIEEKSELVATNFVVYGYIDPCGSCGDCEKSNDECNPLKPLLGTWGEGSKAELLRVYREKLAAIRYDVECSGCEFNGMIAFTDKQAQASINTTLSLFDKGIMKQTKFKFVDGWQIMNAVSMTKLAIDVVKHVQTSFNAEENISSRLASKSLKELAHYVDNPYNTATKADAGDLTKEFKEEVSRLKSVVE